MRTENTLPLVDRLVLGAGIILLFFLHFFRLREVPGLHFDEAWAMNHALRIFHGEFTLRGMSPYTAPWTHYWAALFFAFFGVSLWVFRFSQVLLSLLGIFFLALSLWRTGRVRGAAWLPLTICLLPGLVFNQRFFIELNSFHVFCFGLFCFFLTKREAWGVVLFWFLGSTAHILFYPVGLAVVAIRLWEGELSKREEIFLRIVACFFLGFFLFVALQIPERGKALALVASALALPFLPWLKLHRWNQVPVTAFLLFGSCVFLANAFFFLPGFWQLAFTKGVESWKGEGAVIALLLPLLGYLAWQGAMAFSRNLRLAFLLGVILLGAMMLKAAPRYYEIPLLVLALFVSSGLWPQRGRFFFLLPLALGAVIFYVPYFSLSPRLADVKFLTLKDSSRDFLSKQELVGVLGGLGCKLSDINAVDSRVMEALLALQQGDWPVSEKKCEGPVGIFTEKGEFVVRKNP